MIFCRIWLTRMLHEFMPWRDCDRGYGRPLGRPRVSHPATYHSGTPRVRHPVVARRHEHLHGLASPIYEISRPEAQSATRNLRSPMILTPTPRKRTKQHPHISTPRLGKRR